MGRSKFPGKPSKLVNKKRVSVLQGSENSLVNDSSEGYVDYLPNDQISLWNRRNETSTFGHGGCVQSVAVPQAREKPPSSEPPDGGGRRFQSVVKIDKPFNAGVTTRARSITPITVCSIINKSDCTNKKEKSEDKTVKKKTVTFKNSLETSDDASAVKKVYNPDNAPLVPIIKKECLSRSVRLARSDCIVRPSRLTEIIKSNANNIDKLNFLTFKSTSSSLKKETNVPCVSLQSSENTESSVNRQKEEISRNEAVVVGDKRFVLPKRSAHSCRVIKPNKRFLDNVDFSVQNIKKINATCSKKSGKNQPRYEESTSDYNCQQQNCGNTQQESFINNTLSFQINSSKLNEDDISEVDDETFKISHQVTDDTQSDFSEDDTGNALRTLCRNNPSNSPSTSFFGAFAGSKVILRQPRLQFDLQTKLSSSISNTKSMFTATNRSDDNAPVNLVNTNYCGVCGTTCKTLQQSQKFGIFSCEACRKFISKSIKKLAASPENSELSALQCVRGDGTCIISPFLRGNMNKNLKKTFKERCQACWLKKCVMSFHVSTGLRNRLLAKLPASLIESEKSITQLNIKKEGNASTEITNILSNSLFSNPKLINWTENIDTAILPSNTLAENNATFGSSPLIRNKILEKRVFSINSIECNGSNLLNEKKMLNPVTCSKLVCDEEINKNKFRPKDRENSTVQQLAIDAPKRQRIDLKGPRVKHVCRSASIVLGHPIATFPNDITTLETMDTPPRPYSPSCGEVELSQSMLSEEQSVNCTNCDSTEPNLGLSPPATPTQGDTLEICENYKKIENGPKPFTRKISRPLLSKKVLREKGQANSSPAISIDFWENYDPAEVSQTGFGLILTESIAIRALCFLCGSAGLDLMIFCSCCCEPYHQYCVEDEYNLKHSALDETMTSILDLSLNIGTNMNLITNRLNWLCPRCTVCYTCNMSSGSKVKCQKCQKNYHTTCLGTSKRLLGADRPLICASCLKCKSCTTTKVTKFVGNLPMCSQCFKLRKRGNYCPTCQKCYEDNDFDLKMMECGDCQRWVHAKCEGLSDEQYNLLSTLPESIEFICKKCSKTNAQSNLWRQAVASEFKSGLLSVVKLLSKSRQAYALLKLSPRKKSMNCICEPIQTSRTLNFNSIVSDTKSTDEESQNSELSALEDVYIFKEIAQINKCYCNSNQKLQSNVPSLVDIKSKINSGEYVSLAEFNYDMSNVISAANCDELIIVYKEILSETFPWFQNETRACTDLLEEDMFDSSNFTQTSEVECDQQVPVIDLPENLDDYFYPPSKKEDIRPCMFCKGIGERITIQESRLLYCGHNLWVHINCAMWSAEVFEEIDGSLQNVHSAISRGRLIKCTHCGNRGATVGCNIKSCGEHYHYPCARKSNCAFLTDKTVYCPQHQNELTKKKCANIEKSFEVQRPVYVELDRKRKKMVDPSKVQFLIGSLEVKNMGNIFSKLSDSNEALIPVDFQCTRLYWSIKEPWKIVEYTVKTSIESNVFTFSTDCGRHFTVDHANSSSIVQLGLAQIGRWHNSLLLGEDNDMLLRQERSVKQVLEVVGQNYNTDDAIEEEPQNNADLLPPEIKDAIFEDLPHELLDGISMLDIFPKLMIYEDMIAVDSKAEGFYTSEYTKDGITSEEDGNDSSHKELDMSNSWPMSTGISHMEDAMLSAIRPITCNREIKRSKSEIFQRSIGNSRSQQRASSLTYSCKIDSASAKRRKISKGHQDIRISESVLLSIGRRKEDLPVLDRCRSSQNEDIKTKTFSWSAAKKYSQTEMKTIHEKSVIPRDFIDKLKISQLDGMDDLVNENEFTDFSQMRSVHDKNMPECPVKCDRCNCTYRTRDSYQRHLTNCDLLSTSESESETARSPPLATHNIVLTTDITNINKNVQPSISIVQNINQSSLNTMNTIPITSHNTTNTIPISCSMQNIQFQNLQNNSIPITQLNHGLSNIFITNSQQNSQHQYFPLQTINGTHLLQPKSDIPTVSVSTNVLQQQPQIFTMSASNGNQQVVAITPQQSIISQSNRSTNSAMCQKPQIYCSQNEKGAPKIKSLQRIHQTPTSRLKSKMGHASKPILMKKTFQRPESRTISIVNQNIPTPGLVLQHNTNTQPIIVQQVNNNPNIVSYVTDGHNQQMQYITVPSANDFKQPQTPFLTTNPLVQGAFLQTDSSGNLVLTNGTSGLQMLSAPLQIAQQTQPQVIGTLLQPQTGALQCGVMSAEQMVLGPGPTIEMVTNPTMLLASQPVYYGLETIVQNTVMSSQQFVSTAMQGVLSQNASFSATTTQVFQASKIEPIMEVPAGYVVLNNVDGTIMQQSGSQPNIISANVLQQPIPQLQSEAQQVHSQVQPQQINTHQIQPIYNIHQHHPQQQSMMHQQHCHKLRAVSPVKPAMKATQISKLGSNRSITNNQSHVFQDQKSSPIIISKTVSITPAVDSNPIVMQTTTTALNNVPKILKSTPVSIAQQYPLKTKVNAMASNATLMPIQLVQRKMNMIRPLNKSSSVNIKPKIGKQVTSKNNTQCKTTIQAPTLIAPKPQYLTQRNIQQNVAQQSCSSDTNLQPMQFNVSLVESDLSQQIKSPSDFISGLMTTEQSSFLKTTSLADVSATCNNNVYQQSNNFQYSVNCTVSSSQPINLPTSSSSIQLPSAPFISPYGNNIPTNIVNPIQQMATSQSSNIVSRPTNRVLPMQTIQQKLASSTSTEHKDDEIKIHDKNLNSDNDFKNISKGQYMKLNILEKSQAEVNNFINTEMELESESNIAAATEIMAINARDSKNEAYKEKILENETLLDNDFEIKASSDDKSEITTSEVKEKICKILENLDEECDKSPLMEGNFVQNDHKIIDKTVEQKENVDLTNLIECCKTEATPIKYKTCSLSKPTGPRLLYEIQSEDGFTYKSTSITEIWEKVFEAVQVARKAHGLLPLPEGPLADMCGIQMLGLKTNALKYLIEQLPGVERCTKYTPKYNKKERKYNCEYLSDQEELKENHFGSTRCEPFSTRSDYDMFSWLASRHRKQPIQVVIQPSENELIPRRGTGSNLPMAMKYRTLKETYKDYVGVFRSHIHGRGLYCTKDIEAGEMVIEYAGELIRSTLTDKRERHYDSKGIGCYMFKIDDNLVVDATMRGNAARFINHSCEPNCYSKVVDILGHKHIIIFALRRIVQGEELTYDYKFPFEDIKIPCSCGSKKCRKYLN